MKTDGIIGFILMVTLHTMWAMMTPMVAVITVTAMPCSNPYT